VSASGTFLWWLNVTLTNIVIASGSDRHKINFFHVNGTYLNSIVPNMSFLPNTRSSPIAATAFHPHRMLFACSALNDQHVNIFTCQSRRPKVQEF
jgi:regulator-associated protein of mTOR